MKLLLFGIGGLIAWFLYEKNANASDNGSQAMPTIPGLLAPVNTDSACIGKIDEQGNWYGVNISGNCTIEALGGSSGEW